MTPIVTPGGSEGQWRACMSAQFGNGIYSAYMQQYKATDWDQHNPVGNATMPVTFTVRLDTLALGASDGGMALALSPGCSSTLGNWLELNITGSTMHNATLVAFATNAFGTMLKHDGTGTATTLNDAALAQTGPSLPTAAPRSSTASRPSTCRSARI